MCLTGDQQAHPGADCVWMVLNKTPYFRAAYVLVKLLRVFVTLNVPSCSADTLIQNAGPV